MTASGLGCGPHYGGPMTHDVALGPILDDLRTLVEVESPSGDPVALAASADVVADLLERRLGGLAVLVDGPAGPHVHWSGGGEPRVLVLGHHDTVFPAGTLARRPFAVAEGKITGPGVFDMLGGLVQAIHAVALLDDRSGVEILVTADEENGSVTSRALLEERALACGTVLVMEGAADGGDLKVGRKGCGTFEVTVTGRAAHAGLEPEAGVNALVEAAHQVLAIAALNRPEVGTTVTPTVLHSGGQSNVVPDAATVVVDVRVETADEKDRVEAAFAALVPLHPEAALTVAGSVNRPPMTPETSTDLFALAASLEPGIRGVSVGGGSDGNFTAALGVPTLDGLGAVGGGAHADTEHVLVDTVVGRVRLVAGLVRAIVG
ncbi:acetylornithine deacetylase/succinyldiaminopimelate desuccinylase-like deacylase [Sanguibacter keddieii DSM 10542]|uniref:Acetylornithine deacetylase/succinyldiaminopimelate desuccinylase-like deacylase n=2 Tax=Sanguibacter keddieii TaxID=60920 RepID=D1BEA9_SANKS|nr:acetylornithine deacetylase/succinyldiaminopimelate desuccinylase-like deacylase [Sanguibacter keddieii DSM 10542]